MIYYFKKIKDRGARTDKISPVWKYIYYMVISPGEPPEELPHSYPRDRAEWEEGPGSNRPPPRPTKALGLADQCQTQERGDKKRFPRLPGIRLPSNRYLTPAWGNLYRHLSRRSPGPGGTKETAPKRKGKIRENVNIFLIKEQAFAWVFLFSLVERPAYLLGSFQKPAILSGKWQCFYTFSGGGPRTLISNAKIFS